MLDYDVLICGAGPAGTTCALGLFDAGLKVALVDKHTFPREKICGDAYGGYAYKILNTISERFGSQLLELKAGNKTNRVKLVSPKGYLLDLKLKGFFSNLPRQDFDHFLLDMVKRETGTVVMENTTVQKIKVEKDHVLVSLSDDRTLKAGVVVGCDGAHSVVQSALTGTRELVTDTCPGLRGYYKNVSGLEQDCLEIHFLKRVPKGYFWIFPSTNGLANVGIGADKDVITKHKINLRKELAEIISAYPQFKERFAQAELVGEVKGWTIPLAYFESALPVSGNRILLCGDAAAIVDPATGEGIAPAMSSGRFAARQIKSCFARNDFSESAMKGYDRMLRKKYYWNYFYKTALANLYYSLPFLMDWAILFFQKTKGRRQI